MASGDLRRLLRDNYRPERPPLSKMAYGVVPAFPGGCTEFAMGWLLVERADTFALAMALWDMAARSGAGQAPWSRLAALSILTSVPAVLVFIVLRRTLLNRVIIDGFGE